MAQLFIEVLVLAAGAAGVALVMVRLVGEYIQGIASVGLRGGLPFWIDLGTISFRTVLFAAGLAVFAATIAGIVPALHAGNAPGGGWGHVFYRRLERGVCP